MHVTNYIIRGLNSMVEFLSFNDIKSNELQTITLNTISCCFSFRLSAGSMLNSGISWNGFVNMRIKIIQPFTCISSIFDLVSVISKSNIQMLADFCFWLSLSRQLYIPVDEMSCIYYINYFLKQTYNTKEIY